VLRGVGLLGPVWLGKTHASPMAGRPAERFDRLGEKRYDHLPPALVRFSAPTHGALAQIDVRPAKSTHARVPGYRIPAEKQRDLELPARAAIGLARSSSVIGTRRGEGSFGIHILCLRRDSEPHGLTPKQGLAADLRSARPAEDRHHELKVVGDLPRTDGAEAAAAAVSAQIDERIQSDRSRFAASLRPKSALKMRAACRSWPCLLVPSFGVTSFT
jgi:hypothetical protein